MRQTNRELIRLSIMVLLAAVIALAGCSQQKSEPSAADAPDAWAQDFNLAERHLRDQGMNTYFILKPGYRLVLANDNQKVTITVLNETLQIGDVTVRVVEEREEEDGEVVEISRNYFALCAEMGDVFYFGEGVDMVEDEEVVSHAGAWRADEEGCQPGLMMPGQPIVGSKYYMEFAPGRALDRAEVVSVTDTLVTPAGTFTHCLKTLETSGLDADEREYKTYAPGVGLIQDEDLLLVSYGFIDEE